MVMTKFAGYFLRVEKVRFHCGSVSVMAHAASLQHPGIMSVDSGKPVALMAIETATLENKTATPA
jgi:hypothetical protein